METDLEPEHNDANDGIPPLNIKAEMTDMQNYLEEPYSDEPTNIQNRIVIIGTLLARSAYLMIYCDSILRKKKRDVIMENILEMARAAKLSAKMQYDLLDSLCEEEMFNAAWSERIHRTCTHQGDHLRTLLSYAKEQLRLGPYGT